MSHSASQATEEALAMSRKGMELVLTSAMKLLSRPSIIHESRPLMNLLLIRAKDLFINRPTIILSSSPPPSSSSSSSCRSSGTSNHTPPPLPPWFYKLAAYCRNHFDTVPYTNRNRFLLISPATERRIGNYMIENHKSSANYETLPSTHPDSCRVQRIFERIMQAAVHRAGVAKHLPFDWEVIIQRDKRNSNNILSYVPGGKLLLYARVLEDFTTDAEIALLISRQVALAIVRPHVEYTTNCLWLMLPHIILLPWFPYLCLLSGTITWTLLPKLPFNQRLEMEANYIGLLLFASAAYDPCDVWKTYVRLIHRERKNKLLTMIDDYFFTLPSYKKISKLEIKAVEEALNKYDEVIATSNGEEKVG